MTRGEISSLRAKCNETKSLTSIDRRISTFKCACSHSDFAIFRYMEYGGFTYIMTNQHNTTLYTGVTSELQCRVIQHREKHYPNSFTARYSLTKLVFLKYMMQLKQQ